MPSPGCHERPWFECAQMFNEIRLERKHTDRFCFLLSKKYEAIVRSKSIKFVSIVSNYVCSWQHKNDPNLYMIYNFWTKFENPDHS